MGTMARSARIAALPLAFGGRAVAGWGRRLAGADAEQVSASAMERNAEQLFAVLGQLKGGAMKIGQALSVYDSMIPAEIAEPYQRALAKLQSAGPTMPAKTVHAVLAEQLGRDWQRRFRSFDDTPAAAASVGQVHHAVWAAGRGAAAKTQSPGSAAPPAADRRPLERFSRLFPLIVPALDAKALVRELRDRMLDELDYRAEADRQRRFAAAYAGDPDLHVPAVVASAPKVIVSEWLDGVSLGTMTARPAATAREQALRDDWAHTIIQTMFSSPERAGMLHADPHPGNFMVLSDGRLAMIDFGAVAELPDGFPPVLARILRHVADAEPAKMMRLMLVLRYIGALADPLRTDTFRFHRAWMAQEGSRVLDLRGKALRSLALPPQHLVIVRVLSGWTNILALLDCTVAARALAEEWLPEF